MGSAKAAAGLLILLAAARPAAAQDRGDGAVLVFYDQTAVGDGVEAALEQAAERHATTVVDLSPPVPAPAEAPRQLTLAIEAYQDFKYDETLARADQGLTEAEQSGARGLNPSELSDLYVYRALALTEKGDTVRAWEDFVRAAAIDPARQLDPVRFSPKVIEGFHRATVAVAAAPTTALTIDAPADCARFVDGRALTDATGPVTGGEHFVRLECPGDEPYANHLTIAGAQQTLTPTLHVRRRLGPAEVAAQADQRGFARAVLVEFGTGQLLSLRLLGPHGKTLGRVTTRLGKDPAPAVAAALDRLLAPPVVAQPVVVPVPARRWYQQPWLWGVAGATAAAAVLLPFALSSSAAASGFDIRPSGLP